MAAPRTPKAADASNEDAEKSPKNTERQEEISRRGPGGPTTKRGKQKSRQNAIKHGIFAVGIIPKRESEADYLRIFEDMVEAMQPIGRLEEILVEKSAMLLWRYRRLLQAEAAEVANQAAACEQKYLQNKFESVRTAKKDQGLINQALDNYNEVAPEAAITSLKSLRQQTSEKGLDWERDRQAIREVYGPMAEPGVKARIVSQLRHEGRVYKGLDPDHLVVQRYRELVYRGEGQPDATDIPREAAESVVRMFTEDIERFDAMLQDWRQHGDDRNRLEEARMLVPWEDRLQRYEASLERSFDRTLSQLDRLQRLRSGQPVLPAVRVDLSQ
jgi:hypothetical protein